MRLGMVARGGGVGGGGVTAEGRFFFFFGKGTCLTSECVYIYLYKHSVGRVGGGGTYEGSFFG